ncbi:UPF0057-domain-containing protein [Aspergillus taichungensis]|uniref:UPF0057-domain-containing protein n=1 Tax=Aspergillus taichungensis TaxID=482145 RepID=A0A2J5I6L9_9EURO|nr:UPF0057-domain-containing protein [Aspergillus taichungensis]
MCSSDIFLGVLAIFFPPVAVWIKKGLCTADSVINLALCCLGYIPGLLHAWYVIIKNPEPDYDDPNYEPIPRSGSRDDVEGGRVTYYYVSHQSPQLPPQRGYGTVDSQGPPAQRSPKPQNQNSGGSGSGGQGSSQDNSHHQASDEPRPPPTYAEAVRGDHKVQTDE